MLPWLQKKNVAGLIISQRTPDGAPQEQHSEGDEDHGLDACSEDLIRAVNAKDTKGVTAALRAVFELLESEPHEEGEGTFEEQNIKAAKEQG